MNSTLLKNKFLSIYAILLVLVSLLYANTLQSPFLFDDEKNIENNPGIRDIYNFTHISAIGYRHAVSMTYALNHHLGGLNPFGYHLFNIIVHACAVLLVFLIAFITLEKGARWGKATALKIAFPTALLFAANPAQSEAVTYISGRPSTLAAFFFLLSLFFFIQGGLQKPGTLLPRPLLFLLSMIFFFISVVSKETALTLPLVIVLYDICFMRSKYWVSLKTRILCFYAFIPALAVLFTFKSSASISIFKWWLGHTDYLYALNQIKVVAFAFKLFFLPLNLTAEYDFSNTIDFIALKFIFSAIFWVVVLWLTARHKTGKSPVLFFSVLWYLATISPTNSIIPREDMLSERNLYLPSFGLCLLFSALFCSWPGTPSHSIQNKPDRTIPTLHNKIFPLFIIGLLAIITSYSCLLMERNSVYKSRLAFWEDTYDKTPQKLRVLHNLSAEYIRTDNHGKALVTLRRMQLINPKYYFAHINLSRIYMQYGNFRLVEIECRKAIESNPDQFEAYFNLGSLYARLGLLAPAAEMYKTAKGKSGAADHPELLLNLASVHFKSGRYEEAEREINDYLPGNRSTEGRLLLAQIYGKTGRARMAEKIYLQDIKDTVAQQAVAHNFLGLLYIGENRLEDAQAALERAIAFNPRLIEAHMNLAKILMDRKKEPDKALPHLKIAAEINTDPQQGELIANLIAQIRH